MPNRNGLDATKEIRNFEKTMKNFSPEEFYPSEIYTQTASEDQAELDLAIEFGSNDVLVKPLSMSILQAKITRAVIMAWHRSKLEQWKID
jgi:CheY-like chemotaxis protein